MSRSISARSWFVLVVSLWAIVLVGVWVVNGVNVVSHRDSPPRLVDKTVSNPASSSKVVFHSSSAFPVLDPEENLIWRAQYIGHGTVTSVSTSCWNNENCAYGEPSTEFSGADEDSFLPFQYYSATIQIDTEWYDTLGLGSPLVVHRASASPYDSPLLSEVPDPITDDTEVVIMIVRRASAFLEGDQTFDWLSGLYEVNGDDSLTTNVYQPSTTLSGLATEVNTVKAYTPTPTPTSGPTATPTRTSTPCTVPDC